MVTLYFIQSSYSHFSFLIYLLIPLCSSITILLSFYLVSFSSFFLCLSCLSFHYFSYRFLSIFSAHSIVSSSFAMFYTVAACVPFFFFPFILSSFQLFSIPFNFSISVSFFFILLTSICFALLFFLLLLSSFTYANSLVIFFSFISIFCLLFYSNSSFLFLLFIFIYRPVFFHQFPLFTSSS